MNYILKPLNIVVFSRIVFACFAIYREGHLIFIDQYNCIFSQSLVGTLVSTSSLKYELEKEMARK